MPKERSDSGGTRVLPDAAVDEIYRLKAEFPRLNATQIHRQLVAGSFIPATVSVCAVQRFVKHHDLKSAKNPSIRDRRAFEEDAFGKLWQADTCYLPYITENGVRRRVYCIMIIDDHSRLLVGGELFTVIMPITSRKYSRPLFPPMGSRRNYTLTMGAAMQMSSFP